MFVFYLISQLLVRPATINFIKRVNGVAPVGGTQGWRHLQWPAGIVRFLDEHELERCHLHLQRWRSLLEASQLLHSGIGSQVLAVTARVVGKGQGGIDGRAAELSSWTRWWARWS